MSATPYVTAVQSNGFFKLPPDKQPTNRFLKKKEDDRPLSEQVLGKVFNEYKDHKDNHAGIKINKKK